MTTIERVWTEDEYLGLVEQGVLSNTQLIYGKVYQNMTPSHAHVRAVDAIEEALVERYGLSFVRRENPVKANGFPEPDLVLLSKERHLLTDHPGASDIEAVIEVAVSSYLFDTSVKLPAYLSAGIKTVFIVVPGENRVSYDIHGKDHEIAELLMDLDL